MRKFLLPQWILQTSIWRFSNWAGTIPPANLPDVTAVSVLVPGTRVTGGRLDGSYLLLPWGTDIRESETFQYVPLPAADPDLVSVTNAGLTQYFTCDGVVWSAAGYANQHLIAYLTQQSNVTAPPPPVGCYSGNTGWTFDANMVIESNMAGGADDVASVTFDPGVSFPQTISLDFTMLPAFNTTGCSVALAMRTSNPALAIVVAIVTAVVGSPTMIEIGDGTSFPSSSFGALVVGQTLELVVTDDGSNILASLYDAVSGSLLGSIMLTTSVSSGTTLGISSTDNTQVGISYLEVDDARGLVWQDNFTATDGTLLTAHTPDAGCSG